MVRVALASSSASASTSMPPARMTAHRVELAIQRQRAHEARVHVSEQTHYYALSLPKPVQLD